MAIVTLQLTSNDPIPVSIPGVVIQIYLTTAAFVTSGVTDSSGQMQVLLPDGLYDILFYKQGISILPKQPQRIEVLSSLENTFSIIAHIKTRSESIDPTRCMVSGYILGADGLKSKHRLIFSPSNIVIINNENIIGPGSRIEVSSDDTGYFEFELLRNTSYDAYFLFPENFLGQPGRLCVITPDLPSVALHSLLFPVPVNMDFSINTLSLVAGGPWDSSIDATLSFSDGGIRTNLNTAWAGISIENSNNLIVDAALRDGKLCLNPLTTGTATISTIRSIPSTITYTPLPTYISETVVITVI